MAINLTDKIVSLVVSLRREDIEALPPAERRRLADHCRWVVEAAETKPAPKPGVLTDLKVNGARAEV